VRKLVLCSIPQLPGLRLGSKYQTETKTSSKKLIPRPQCSRQDLTPENLSASPIFSKKTSALPSRNIVKFLVFLPPFIFFFLSQRYYIQWTDWGTEALPK